MTGIEIFLILTGIIAIFCSFVFAEKLEKNNKVSENNVNISEEMVKERVEKAVENILDEKVEETEVKMDKISNEKIMAVGDYSENVLNEINKNHDEVMFLYGMLNDKEKEVKNAVRDVENVKKSISIIAKNNLESQEILEIKTEDEDTLVENEIDTEQSEKTEISKEEIDNQILRKKSTPRAKINKENETKEFKISVKDPNAKNKGVVLSHKEARRNTNNNKQILELYNEGKNNMEIAKQLGLGMGEVRLVIDLYKNKK